MLVFLLACAPEPADVPAWPRVGDQVDVVLHARRGPDETAWSATVGVNPEPSPPIRACGPEPRVRPGERGFAGMEVDVPAVAPLAWVESTGRWQAEGPRASVDPSWAVGSVFWTLASGTRVEAAGAARFGDNAQVRAIAREDDGSLRVFWDATDDQVSVLSHGIECFGNKTSVRVPWWAVPPAGGAVIVRTARSRTTIVPDLAVVRVRAVIEQVLPVDVPLTTQGQPLPEAPVPREHTPRFFRHVGTFG